MLYYHKCWGKKRLTEHYFSKNGVCRTVAWTNLFDHVLLGNKKLTCHRQFYLYKYQFNCLHLQSKSEYSLSELHQDRYGCIICRYASRGPRVENKTVISNLFVSLIASYTCTVHDVLLVNLLSTNPWHSF